MNATAAETKTEFNTPGHLPSPDRLVDVPRLVTAFYARHPDVANPSERVSFGTSGHRGSSLSTSFNYAHILAITQAICEYRANEKTTGPLFLAQDTHALSDPAFTTALEVLSANGVHVLDRQGPGIYADAGALACDSEAQRRGRKHAPADGIVITPSHNPPEDGGFKYNPPTGGPADTTATKWIENRANELIGAKLQGVKRLAYHRAVSAETTQQYDFISSYVDDLPNIIDFDAIRNSGLKLAVDPLGGAGVHYWPRIAEQYKLPLEDLNLYVDPTFRFMTLDWDGRIRMDCSSPYAMASMIANKDKYDVAWACDTDHDRHGIVARSVGAAESEPLSGGVHSVSVHAPAGVERQGGHRQDAGVVEHD